MTVGAKVLLAESAAEIVERIMTRHWDLAACPCWICESGRVLGLGPREQYLRHRQTNDPLKYLDIREVGGLPVP